MTVADQAIPVALSESFGPHRDANSFGQIPDLFR